MIASFLLSLREGIEAALVIGIVLGVLVKFKQTQLKGWVWGGTGTAVSLSIAAAIGFNLLGLKFEGRNEEIFEGVTMLLAAGLLTWMILWMQQTSRTLKSDLESKTHEALQRKGGWALFALAFMAVFREGIELALFLLAVQQTATPAQTIAGALLGLSTAAILGWVLFTSTRRLSLQGFFRVTNILLIVFAAGLVGLGVHEFNEAGIIPPVIEHVWDINGILDDHSELGLLLKALVGYNGNPSLTEVIAYLAYLGSLAVYMVAQKKPAISSTPATAN